VSKQLLVRFDGNDYSVPTEQAHQPCVVRGFVDRVEIEVNHQPVAVHPRCYGQGEFVLEPLHYLKLLERKPGSLDNARPFKRQDWGANSVRCGRNWNTASPAARARVSSSRSCSWH